MLHFFKYEVWGKLINIKKINALKHIPNDLKIRIGIMQKIKMFKTNRMPHYMSC